MTAIEQQLWVVKEKQYTRNAVMWILLLLEEHLKAWVSEKVSNLEDPFTRKVHSSDEPDVNNDGERD